MNIQENPFYILAVSCAANRREIAAAVDEQGFLLGNEKCEQAQSILINPSKRLSAEMDWFPEATPSKNKEIRECIENGEPISETSLYMDVSRLNIVLYNLGTNKSCTPDMLLHEISKIDRIFMRMTPERILPIHNIMRAKGAFAKIEPEEMVRELGRKRDAIRQMLTAKLQLLPDKEYLACITALADACYHDLSEQIGLIITDVLDQYEVWIQSKIGELQENIKNDAENIKETFDEIQNLTERIERLVGKLQAWKQYAYPLELSVIRTGTDHNHIISFAYELRDLAIFLFNQKNRLNEALALVESLKAVFGVLPEVMKRLEGDSRTLQSIKKRQDEEERQALAHQQVDKEYLVRLKGTHYVAPQFCTCCMTPCKTNDNISYSFTTQRGRTQTTHTTSVNLPLCEECCNHRGKLNSTMRWICLISIIIGLVVGYFLYTQTTIQEDSLLYVAAVSVGCYLVLAGIIKTKALDKKHSSVNKSVSIVTYDGDIIFTFSNWQYATLFAKANEPNASAVTEKDKLNNAKPTSIIKAYLHPIRAFFVVLGLASVLFTFGILENESILSYSTKQRSTNPTPTKTTATTSTGKQPNPTAAKNSTTHASTEMAYSSTSSMGSAVYADIRSIEPSIGIGQQSGYNTDIVCKCETMTGQTIWLYMTIKEYNEYIDPTAKLESSENAYFNNQRYSTGIRIHGKVRSANVMCSGLSTDIGEDRVLVFSSLENTPITGVKTVTSTRTVVPVYNGKVFVKPDYEGVCPLTIKAGSGSDYYVYLQYVQSPARSDEARTRKSSATYPYEGDIAFYVKAGESVDIDVPIGVYKLFYATGTGNFYGTNDLFEETKGYYSSDELMTFNLSGGYYNGHTITLYKVANGNLETENVSSVDFPRK